MKEILFTFLLAPTAFARPALDCHLTLGSGRFNTYDVSLIGNYADGEQPVLFRYKPSDPWMAEVNLGGELRYTSDLAGLELHLIRFGKDAYAATARIYDKKIELTFREGNDLVPPGPMTLNCD